MIKYILLLLFSLNLFGFENAISNQLFFEVFVNSVLIIAFIISMILFVMIKNFSFLFYSFYAFAMATILAFNNQLYHYFFADEAPQFLIIISIITALTSGLWFVLNFVNFFENRESLRRYFLGFSIFSVITILLNYLLNFYITTILHFLVILITLGLIVYVLLKSIKKNPLAKLLLIGWSSIFLGMLYNISLLFGFFEDEVNYAYYYVGGAVIFEVLIFALALGLQLKYKNDERIEAIKNYHKQQLIIEHQSRFATIGKILAGVEHQWRSPLNYLSSITLELQTMLFTDEKVDTNHLKESVSLLEDIIFEMDKTMSDFRYFYLPNKTKESFRLSQIFYDTFAYFVRYSNKNIGFKIDDRDELIINSYPNHFKHILINFLDNSLKVAKNRGLESLEIEINIFRDDDFLVCEIIDNAGGAKNIDKIFEPFYSEQNKSSGIGLYLVQELVANELKGEIFAKNYKDGLQILLKVPFES